VLLASPREALKDASFIFFGGGNKNRRREWEEEIQEQKPVMEKRG
jgi:hypothetical protein